MTEIFPVFSSWHGPFYVQTTASLNVLKHRKGLFTFAKVAVFVLSKVNINRNTLSVAVIFRVCVCSKLSESILSLTLDTESNLLRSFAAGFRSSNPQYIWRDFHFAFLRIRIEMRLHILNSASLFRLNFVAHFTSVGRVIRSLIKQMEYLS